MSNIIPGIARYLSNDVDALDVLSQNVANMRTAGYRAERLATDFKTGLLENTPTLDLADGSLSTTGHPLDLAIRGTGFFAVDVNGQTMLTRNGQFHIDADQQLVDSAGNPVLGQSGPITLNHANVHIDASGAITDGSDNVDTLRIVNVDKASALRDMGDGLYSFKGNDSGQFIGRIQQGALEQSNVDPGEEMVRLMALSRHAQSVQRAIQAYDATLQEGINHIGDNS
ncbi:flagellar hook-basal body protein [Dyella caseinilytica]|uniref:Flagellar hook basal-body protein n=1 Tax=Dyella caseinilytica TaxID=1849581 RepID=A0ABX7GNZ9_9GAMM|nr:flagellar hook basal-body protein [Dyella caseinilytica]QRN52071.1 flagellar hook basal-body protein [Dyella caseinilytica]GGA15669.1 flagellar basal-body rod protein FlgF [Dyella caseinilytica]